MNSDELRFQTIRLDGGEVFAVEAGATNAPAVLFLHGWPQSWRAWLAVMLEAGTTHHAVAIDLPGMGKSVWPNAPGSKRALASTVHEVIQRLSLERVTLVGHDAGGQVVYAYLTQYDGAIDRAVIVDVVIPGVAPWEDVIRNPHIWHFAFHAIPELPEMLVQGRQAAYFDYFFDSIAAHSEAIAAESRDAYAAAYASGAALAAGFEWYRAFAKDARDNHAFTTAGGRIETPLLYVRGAQTFADIDVYRSGLRSAGVRDVTTALIDDCGHFAAEEQPHALWQRIREFARR